MPSNEKWSKKDNYQAASNKTL